VGRSRRKADPQKKPARRAPTAHGGARPGAGRKPTAAKLAVPADEIPWNAVERYALTGAPEREITTALGITEAMLQERPIADRFKATIARGHARYKLELREQIKERGNRTRKGAGSVNALGLQARNHLDWDRDIPQQMMAPDLVGARERLRDTLTRLAEARSDIEGKVVSPLEVVYREAFGTGVENPPADLKRS
jgi:hypothetical protein